ncbi:MAG: hypothetical protein SFW08_05750, partial [Gemmatimonadaceae bacterium]|nr:hypothetical protein [Gemmatimonadaceae bacterium]
MARDAMTALATADAVRDGLHRLVNDPASWPADRRDLFINRLLDFGGGDSRAHVTLLWRLHEWGVADRLAAQDAGDDVARVAQVARAFAADAFVERPAAHWGVAAWGTALGLVDATALDRAQAEEARQARERARDELQRRAVLAPSPPRATARGAVGRAAPVGSAARPLPPARTYTMPLRGPTPRDVGLFVTIVLATIGFILGAASLLGDGSKRPGAIVASAPRAAASVAPVAPVTPVTPTESPREQRTDLPPTSTAAALPPGQRAEVDLFDGRRYAGIVDLITATDVYLHDDASGLPYALPLPIVARVRLADGRVWRPTADSTGGDLAVSRPDLVARGVSGRYRVVTRSVLVDGDPSCRERGRAPTEGATSMETITHVPGDSVLAWTSRGTLRARIAADGRFSSGTASGRDGALTWR